MYNTSNNAKGEHWHISKIDSQSDQKCDLAANSMIRFGEILPLWNFLRVLDNFLLSNGAFGKILNILWQIFHAIGKINIFDNGQLLNK